MDCNFPCVLNTAILIFLCCAFVISTFPPFLDYLSYKTTMSVERISSPEGLTLPAITICNKTGYKNPGRHLDMETYLENTMNLSDFLIDINIFPPIGHEMILFIKYLHLVKISWQAKTSFTLTPNNLGKVSRNRKMAKNLGKQKRHSRGPRTTF